MQFCKLRRMVVNFEKIKVSQMYAIPLDGEYVKVKTLLVFSSRLIIVFKDLKI